MKLRLAPVLLMLFLSAARVMAAPTVIEFGPDGPLPYTEDGLTLANVGVGPEYTPMSLAAGGLAGGSIIVDTNHHVRASGAQPFTLHSLSIEFLAFSNPTSPYRIESSNGAVVIPTQQGSAGYVIDFTSMPGWSNITYFDVIYDGPDVRNTIWIDDVTFAFVPEPSTCSLALLAVGILRFRRRAV